MEQSQCRNLEPRECVAAMWSAAAGVLSWWGGRNGPERTQEQRVLIPIGSGPRTSSGSLVRSYSEGVLATHPAAQALDSRQTSGMRAHITAACTCPTAPHLPRHAPGTTSACRYACRSLHRATPPCAREKLPGKYGYWTSAGNPSNLAVYTRP